MTRQVRIRPETKNHLATSLRDWIHPGLIRQATSSHPATNHPDSCRLELYRRGSIHPDWSHLGMYRRGSIHPDWSHLGMCHRGSNRPATNRQR